MSPVSFLRAKGRYLWWPLCLLIAFGLSWVRMRSVLRDVWQTGVFLDPDDAMRLSEVRSFLQGQSWFDLTAYRLDPAHPVVMHWSRLVDAPIAFLIQGFE